MYIHVQSLFLLLKLMFVQFMSVLTRIVGARFAYKWIFGRSFRGCHGCCDYVSARYYQSKISLSSYQQHTLLWNQTRRCENAEGGKSINALGIYCQEIHLNEEIQKIYLRLQIIILIDLLIISSCNLNLTIKISFKEVR